MLGYLSLDVICSSKLTVFLELRSRKTVRFLKQIMSCMFSRQMEAIVYKDARVLLANTPLVQFTRNYIRDSSGVFFVSSQVKIYCSCHSNIKLISSRHRATSFIYSMSTLVAFDLASDTLLHKALLSLINNRHIYSLKVIPQYCIAHPYCARFLRH